MIPLRYWCNGVVALALLSGSPTRAGAQADEHAERERIRAERALAEATYVQQVNECATRFVVTSCVDAAKAERRGAMARLDEQQLVLDEAQRKQRAAERLQGIEDKVSGEEARRREEAAQSRSANQTAAGEPKPFTPSASGALPRTAKPAVDEAKRLELEAKARRNFELKQLQAEAHRREVELRNQQRARKTNPGVALPTPAASAVLPPASGPAP